MDKFVKVVLPMMWVPISNETEALCEVLTAIDADVLDVDNGDQF